MKVVQIWLGKAWPGRAWRGMAVSAWQGAARLGMAGEARRGAAWLGEAWRGRARQGNQQFFAEEKRMVYQWKAGSRIAADAELVGKELETLGKIKTPEMVVDLAKDEQTESHKCFIWDNEEAAEEYRIIKAREILRSMVVIVERQDKPGEDDDRFVAIRCFENVSISDKDGSTRRAYVATTVALKNDDLREQVMGRLSATIGEAETIADNYSYLCNRFANVREHLRKARQATKA